MPKKKESSQSLFARLARLFRSGPVVKRKVRAVNTSAIMPDQKSSGMLLFQKAHGSAYASITSQAYNMSERLMRYQDFQEMEYTPELASALDIYCLAPDTVVPLLDGTKHTVKSLFDAGWHDFHVYSFDSKAGKFVPGLCRSVVKTGLDQQLFRVTFDDGTYVRLTSNHLVLLSDGEYRRVCDLRTSDSVRSLYTRISSKERGDRLEGYQQLQTPAGLWEYTHRITAEHSEPAGRGVVHHKNFKKLDNSPANLQFMTWGAHQQLHADHNTERWTTNPAYASKMACIFSEHAKSLHTQPGWTQLFLARRNEVFASYAPEVKKQKFGRAGRQNGMFGRGAERRGSGNGRWNPAFVRDVTREQIIGWISAGRAQQDVCRELPMRTQDMHAALKRHGIEKWAKHAIVPCADAMDVLRAAVRNAPCTMNLRRNFGTLCQQAGVTRDAAYVALNAAGYKTWGDFIEKTNHRVMSIVPDGRDDVYDLTVDEHHNFAIAGSFDTDSYVVVHNSDETMAQDEKGRVLHIHSDNPRIKDILEDLFYDTLNIDFNGRPWVRNACKYGDMCLYIDVSAEHGVLNVFPIPINEIEREENYDPRDPFAVRYKWLTGNKRLENWEVAHFRLLGNDMFLPYGTSVLEAARRIWRQLILIEDAMLVYRITRAPERRVFYFDVGNMAPEAIPAAAEELKMHIRANQVTDARSGRVDLRYNPMPLWGGQPVPLLDGRTLRLDEVAAEFEAGKENWVYSVQDSTNRLVPGKVAWCGKNYTATKLVKVTLDDGTWIKAAPEHPFLTRDGQKVRADELVVGQSLMPLYKRLSSAAADHDIEGYPMTYDPSTERYKFDHRVVANDVLGEDRERVRKDVDWTRNKSLVVHHKNFNRLDASPENLQWMGSQDHLDYHASIGVENLRRYNTSEAHRTRTADVNRRDQKAQKMGAAYNGTSFHASHNVNRRQGQLASWSTDRGGRSRAMRWVIPDAFFELGRAKLRAEPSLNRDRFHAAMMNDPVVTMLLEQAQTTKRDLSKLSYAAWVAQLKRSGCSGFDEYKRTTLGMSPPPRKNHKVVAVDVLDEVADVYCMTVMGSKSEDDRHNFAVCGMSDPTNEQMAQQPSGVFVGNSVDEDYYIPVRGSESGTKIDTLAGGQNTAAVEDVEYIQKKMFAAIKIPRAYLGYDEMLCLAPEARVPLLGGGAPTIEELARRTTEGAGRLDDVWTYSCDPATGRVVPGRIVRAWKTKDVLRLLEVELDDGAKIRCTENHPFLCRDGAYRRADELVTGQSLMPLYRRLSSRRSRELDGYEQVLCNDAGEWRYTHRLVADSVQIAEHASRTTERSYVVHHVDHDKRNNAPSNLVKMGKRAHVLYHAVNGENLLSQASRDALRLVMKTDAYRQTHHAGVVAGWVNDDGKRRAAIARWNAAHKRTSVTIEQLAERARASRSTTEFFETCGLSQCGASNVIKRAGHVVKEWLAENVGSPPGCTFEELVAYCKVHGVMDAMHFRRQPLPPDCPVDSSQVKELLAGRGYRRWSEFESACLKRNHSVVAVRVVDLEVPLPVYDLEVEGVHNFAVVDRDDHHATPSTGVFVHNSSKATLAQEDIRFSRTIAIIQKMVIAELNKIAIIHLFAHGFETEDLLNFTLKLSNPSTVAQQQKLELMRARFEIAGSAPEGLLDKKYLRREVLDLSEERIREIDENRLLDKQVDDAIDAAEGGGSGGGGGGGGGGLFGGGGGGAAPDDLGGGDDAGDLGDLGGDDAAPDDAGEEPEEDINAGEEPEEDEDPGVELLTGADDPGHDGPRALPSTGARALPIKPGGQLARALYNRSRRRTHGASRTHMPDFGRMVSVDHAVEDPTDSRWFKAVVSDPFGEGSEQRTQRRLLALSADTRSMLERMALRLGMAVPSGFDVRGDVLTEDAGRDVQAQIDAGRSFSVDETEHDVLSIDAEVT